LKQWWMMPLANDIQALRDRVLAELHAAHDYHVDTLTAWRIVRRVVAAGNQFSYKNKATGTISRHADLARKGEEYVSKQVFEATFLQFVSIFESFFFDLLRLWLLAYPRSLSAKQLAFKAVLDAPDKEAIAQLVVDKELNEVLYERPAAWFAYLEE
jgi:hypothetical protein